MRRKWAADLDLLHKRDGREWQEVFDAIEWVFHGQTGDYRFVVQSPDALRAKWDRIALAMAKRPAQQQQDSGPWRPLN